MRPAGQSTDSPPAHHQPGQDDDTPPPSTLIHEARRLYLRYAEEVVEALQLCPWARSARLAGEVEVHVRCEAHPTPEQLVAQVAQLAERQQTAIALIIMPRLQLSPVAFQHWTAALRSAADAATGRQPPAWAIADFHPAGPVDLSSAAQAVAATRRTPDPTLQLVRLRVLHEMRARNGEGKRFVDLSELNLDADGALAALQTPTPLHERVAERNFIALQGAGLSQLLQRQQDIAADRDATYARLGLPPSPWSSGQSPQR